MRGETKEQIKQQTPKSTLFHVLNSEKAGLVKDEMVRLASHRKVMRTLNYLKSLKKVIRF